MTSLLQDFRSFGSKEDEDEEEERELLMDELGFQMELAGAKPTTPRVAAAGEEPLEYRHNRMYDIAAFVQQLRTREFLCAWIQR